MQDSGLRALCDLLFNPFGCGFAALSLFFVIASVTAEEPVHRPVAPTSAAAVLIDYFYDPGCDECDQIENKVLPRLKAEYEGQYRLNRWDLGIKTNYISLVACLERLGTNDTASVYMVVDSKGLLAGYPAISNGLWSAIDSCLQPPPSTNSRTPIASFRLKW
jgi:hypothetical protein